MINIRNITITGIILAAIVSRFIPHPPNFTPILSICLFTGAIIGDKKISILIPIIIMLISDYFLGFHNTLLWVYLSMVLVVVIGINLIDKIKPLPIILGISLSSISFYLITNFGVWSVSNVYPPTFSGLMLCYAAGIPFLKNTIASNIFFSGIFFGVYGYISEKYFTIQTINNKN